MADNISEGLGRLHTFLEELIRLTKEATEWMQDLHRKNAEVRLQMKRISIDCLGVAEQSRAYLQEVHHVAWYAERYDRDWKRRILSRPRQRRRRCCCLPRPPNYMPINNYTKQLKRCIRQAEKKYEPFHSSIYEFLHSLAEVSHDCEENEGAARTKEVATKVTGGVITSGAMVAVAGAGTAGAAAGIGFSSTAGAATLGAGAVVGLVGIGVTHYVASEFKGSKKMFQEMVNYINEMSKCGKNLQSSFSEVRVLLNKVDGLIKDVERSAILAQDIFLNRSQFLFERLNEFGIKIAECRESLNRNIETLQATNLEF